MLSFAASTNAKKAFYVILCPLPNDDFKMLVVVSFEQSVHLLPDQNETVDDILEHALIKEGDEGWKFGDLFVLHFFGKVLYSSNRESVFQSIDGILAEFHRQGTYNLQTVEKKKKKKKIEIEMGESE